MFLCCFFQLYDVMKDSAQSNDMYNRHTTIALKSWEFRVAQVTTACFIGLKDATHQLNDHLIREPHPM